MTTTSREQAVLASVGTEINGNSYSHVTAEVTITATMANGSLLVAAGTEAAIADAATVTGIIDDAKIGDGVTYAVGEVVMTRIGTNNLIANTDVINFSDGAYTDETLTALLAKGVKLQSAATTYDYK